MSPHAMQETWVPSLGQEDSPGGGHGNPLLYSCLENSMGRGAWWAAVHGVKKSWAQLSAPVCTHPCTPPHTHIHTHMRKLKPRGNWVGGTREVWIQPVWFHSPCSEFTLNLGWGPRVCYFFFPKCPLLLLSHSVVSNSLWPHGLQHARLPCPSSSPPVCSDSCPLSWWCHPTISSSVVPFSRLQSFLASGPFPMNAHSLYSTGWYDLTPLENGDYVLLIMPHINFSFIGARKGLWSSFWDWGGEVGVLVGGEVLWL